MKVNKGLELFQTCNKLPIDGALVPILIPMLLLVFGMAKQNTYYL